MATEGGAMTRPQEIEGRLDGLEVRTAETEEAVDALQRAVEGLREDLRALARVVAEAEMTAGAD
jgi:hypothetical protein